MNRAELDAYVASFGVHDTRLAVLECFEGERLRLSWGATVPHDVDRCVAIAQLSELSTYHRRVRLLDGTLIKEWELS